MLNRKSTQGYLWHLNNFVLKDEHPVDVWARLWGGKSLRVAGLVSFTRVLGF